MEEETQVELQSAAVTVATVLLLSEVLLKVKGQAGVRSYQSGPMVFT